MKFLMHRLYFRQVNTTQLNKSREKTGDVENKISDASGLVITAFPNVKIGAVENEIPNVSGLEKKTVYDPKISEIEGKCFTTSDFHKFINDILDVEIKEKELLYYFFQSRKKF